jgi:putative solute:sodium symporter small subunit
VVFTFALEPVAKKRTEAAASGEAAMAGRRLPLHVHIRSAQTERCFEGGFATMAPSPSQSNTDEHWKKTTRLMLTHLGVWFFFGYIIHMFVNQLNAIKIPILEFPLGFYMAAQGSLIVFVVMLFVFAKQQNRIDREFGMAEED